MKVLHLLNYHVLELNSSLLKCSNKKAVPYKRWLTVQDEIKYKNYRKYYKNVIREAEVNYYVLQFETKFNSVKQIWHNFNGFFVKN